MLTQQNLSPYWKLWIVAVIRIYSHKIITRNNNIWLYEYKSMQIYEPITIDINNKNTKVLSKCFTGTNRIKQLISLCMNPTCSVFL